MSLAFGAGPMKRTPDIGVVSRSAFPAGLTNRSSKRVHSLAQGEDSAFYGRAEVTPDPTLIMGRYMLRTTRTMLSMRMASPCGPRPVG